MLDPSTHASGVVGMKLCVLILVMNWVMVSGQETALGVCRNSGPEVSSLTEQLKKMNREMEHLREEMTKISQTIAETMNKSHTHSMSQSLTHSLTQSIIQSLTNISESLTQSLTESLTQSLTETLTHSFIQSLTQTQMIQFIPANNNPSTGKDKETTEMRMLKEEFMTQLKNDLDLLQNSTSETLNGAMEQQKSLLENFTDQWTSNSVHNVCFMKKTGSTNASMTSIFKDCTDVWEAGLHENGTYFLHPADFTHAFPAYCEFDTDGAWTVIQRRQDGHTDFYRTWDEYRDGFGKVNAEHWLGNAKLHSLTSQGKYHLAIDMYDWRGSQGNYYRAEAAWVRIASEADKFRLHLPSDSQSYSGYFGAGLRVHAGPFCTHDRNTLYGRENCAVTFHAGWWFTSCVTNANLNGRWYDHGYRDPVTRMRARDDIHWDHVGQSLRRVTIKLRREKLYRA